MLVAIVDWIKSIIEKVKDRIQNPFGEDTSTAFAGAFLIAFIVRHWRIVYSILYFDDGELRETRLRIIENYLKGEDYLTLLLYPALFVIAALGIYYIINNITLAMSLFLRDYFRGGILLLFDKRRIRTKGEFDRLWRQLNRAKSNQEKANNELRSVQHELDETGKQLTELNVQHANVIAKLAAAEQSISTLEQELGGVKADDASDSTFETVETFKLVSAYYGWNDFKTDVTEAVDQALGTNKKIAVDNVSLGGDPLRYTIKDLVITYLSKGVRKEISVIEGTIVERVGDLLREHSTSMSEKKAASRNSMLAMAEYFSGQWTLLFTLHGVQKRERVLIDSQGRYFANGKHRFNLRVVSFESGPGKTSFSKIDNDNQLFSKESLNRIAKDSWTGTDTKGHTLEYSRDQMDALLRDPIQ